MPERAPDRGVGERTGLIAIQFGAPVSGAAAPFVGLGIDRQTKHAIILLLVR